MHIPPKASIFESMGLCICNISLLFVVLLLYACGGSSATSPSVTVAGSEPSTSAASPAATPPGSATAATGDDWTTYAHDQQRTGFEKQPTGLSTSSVAGLRLRWKYSAGEFIYSSPLAYGGLIIICTYTNGIVTALDAKSGRPVWQRTLGGQLSGTPTIADGVIFAGTHLFGVGPNGYYAEPSNFYALNLVDGSVKWEASLAGQVRGSPVVSTGRVFVGVGGGDPPGCLRGGIDAFDELSGAALWHWYVDPNGSRGGSVWAPLSYDGSRIVAGTGNTCETPVTTANSIVAIDPASGSLQWSLLAQPNSDSDDDTGGGTLIWNAQAFAINKNGALYVLNKATGGLNFTKQLNPNDGSGGWATPTTDGSTILLSSGSYGAMGAAKRPYNFFALDARREAMAGQSGKLSALDFAGNVRWSVTTQNQIVGYVAINNGVGFASLDNSLTALDISNGAKLWSYTASALLDASPVVVPSGVYAADITGDVYAFSLQTTSSQRR